MILKTIIALSIPIATYSQNINGTYRRHLKCTGCYETLVIKSGAKYERKVDLDWGGQEHNGKYILLNDTLTLTDDSIADIGNIPKGFYYRKKFLVMKNIEDSSNAMNVFTPYDNRNKKIIIKLIE